MFFKGETDIGLLLVAVLSFVKC
uniref:Uncharacterized protein n=1 Tax=Rhizophora mucronata TaxID=61149 RepID=A0A2P2QPS2_RHIMU